MTLIRFNQPALTAVFPHNGNSKFIVCGKKSTVVAVLAVARNSKATKK